MTHGRAKSVPVPLAILAAAAWIVPALVAQTADSPPSINPLPTNEVSATGGPASSDPEPGIKLLLPPTANPLTAVRPDKRLFGILPNYRTDQETDTYKPLKTWEKFKIAERDTFDWPNFFLLAGFAVQTQIAEKGWHETGMGKNFSKYYSRAFGDALIGNYLTEALFPTLFHEDPRFFRSGQGPVLRRAYKAVRQVAVTRTENGNLRFNFSEVLGNTAVVGLTGLYYPGNRRLGDGAQRVAMAIGNDMLSNLMTEFWPDVKRRLQPLIRRHRPTDGPATLKD